MSGGSHPVIYWLRKQPLCVALRCATPLGERILRLDRTAKRPYAEAWSSLRAMNAQQVESLDDKGTVLLALRLEPEDESDEEPESEPVPVNAEGAQLVLLSKLVAEAYRHALEAIKEDHATAFGNMVRLFEAGNARSQSLERSLATMERSLARVYSRLSNQEQQGESSDDNPLNAMMATIAQKMGAGMAAPPAPSPKPNGHAAVANGNGEGEG